MADHASRLGASKSASTLLVLFIPSVDRYHKPIAQDKWLKEALRILGRLFGGATAFPKGRGVWRDDARDGTLVYDKPVVIQCYTSEQLVARNSKHLKEFLHAMGNATNQGAIGLVIGRDYLEISFPLEESEG